MSQAAFQAALERATSRLKASSEYRLTLGGGNLAPGRNPTLCDPHLAQFWQVYATPASIYEDSRIAARLPTLAPAVLLFATLAERVGCELGIAAMNYGRMQAADLPGLVGQVDIFAREGDDLVPLSGRHLLDLRSRLIQASSNHGRLALLAEIPEADWQECNLDDLPLASPQ